MKAKWVVFVAVTVGMAVVMMSPLLCRETVPAEVPGDSIDHPVEWLIVAAAACVVLFFLAQWAIIGMLGDDEVRLRAWSKLVGLLIFTATQVSAGATVTGAYWNPPWYTYLLMVAFILWVVFQLFVLPDIPYSTASSGVVGTVVLWLGIAAVGLLCGIGPHIRSAVWEAAVESGLKWLAAATAVGLVLFFLFRWAMLGLYEHGDYRLRAWSKFVGLLIITLANVCAAVVPFGEPGPLHWYEVVFFVMIVLWFIVHAFVIPYPGGCPEGADASSGSSSSEESSSAIACSCGGSGFTGFGNSLPTRVSCQCGGRGHL